MANELINERVREIATEAAKGHDIEVVHIELAGTKRDAVVRVFIDKPGGVTLEDCSTISREIEAVLDAEDLIASKYVLEVSSPGIERELYSVNDFEKFSGQRVKVRMKNPIDGQRTYVGPILAVNGSVITLDDRSRGTVDLDHADVEKANLKIDLSQEFRGRR